jgi:hypothetical protein
VFVAVAIAAVGTTFGIRSPGGGPAVQLGPRASIWSLGSGGGVLWAMSGRGLWTTTNDGASWTLSRTPSVVHAGIGIEQVQFVDAKHGWIQATDVSRPGAFGEIFRTADGGRSWQPATPRSCGGNGCDYAYVSFLNTTRGYLLASKCVGAPFHRRCASTLYRTGDGALTWRLVSRPSLIPPATITFSTPKLGIAVTGLRWTEKAFITTDGGLRWRPLPMHFSTLAERLSMFGDRIVMPTLSWQGSTYIATVYTSRDGGVHWSAHRVPGSGFEYFQAVSPTTWVGWPGLTITRDGGRSWSPPPGRSGSISDVRFVSARDGWATFGTTLERTTDGGHHWTPAGPRAPKAGKRR